VFGEYEFTAISSKTGRTIHQHFFGRLVAENGKIKLLREALNSVEVARGVYKTGVPELSAAMDEASGFVDAKVEGVATNKAIVLAALTGAFRDHDLSVFNRYWAEDYIQHNTYIPPFREGLRNLAAQLPPGSSCKPGMIIGEGDYVAIHGRYSGYHPVPQIIIDIFRLKDGLLVEHWDVAQDEVLPGLTASGNAQFTNPQQSA
jgi:predicted SnoaL-like aldol condensation-catalyzing enzyme